MNKYDFQLDMNSINSNSAILKNLTPNSKVLELGCAYGRMTKYMRETLNCTIDTIELDEEAGKIAANWANKSFAANIEEQDTWDELKFIGCCDYDHIIFADVLEHLRWPHETLNNAKGLLKDTGTIWISIPNIAHNSVIIDLINNKFNYRDVGILDDTHLKFFTINSLLGMIDKCELNVIKRIDLINKVEYTEFNNSYDELPDDISNLLKNRELGEVYQFVLELSK